jgi:hypothetical protein
MGLLLLFSAAVFAQAPTSPKFLVETSSGEQSQRQIVTLDAVKGLKLAGVSDLVSIGELVSVQQEDKPRPATPRGPLLILANGDQLAGEVLTCDDSTLKLRLQDSPKDRPPLDVPISAISAIWWTALPSSAFTETPIIPGQETTKRRDSLLLRNGDKLTGSVEGFSGNPLQLRLKTAAGETNPIPVASLQSLIYEPGLARVRLPKTAYARVVLQNGTRISVKLPEGTDKSLKATTLFGASVEWPWEEVIAIDYLQSAAVYLSDLKPEITGKPFNALGWPPVADRTVKQNTLQLLTTRGVEFFEKGLGTHPAVEMTYKLPSGAYSLLTGWVGLDSSVERPKSRFSSMEKKFGYPTPDSFVPRSQLFG